MNQTPPPPREPSGLPPDRKRPVRRKTAAQRHRDRMRIIYIIVAIALVLFLLSGLFATAVPLG